MLNSRLSYLVVLFFLFSFVSFGQDEEKGKRIGAIVNAAITEAVPGLNIVKEIFFPQNKTRIKKEEFEKKLEKASKKVKTEVVANFQSKLAPVNSKVEELSLVSKFSLPSSLAEAGLIKLKLELNLPEVNWDLINEDWRVINNNISDIKTIKKDELKVISEKWVEEVLTKILNLNKDELTRLDSRIKAKNKEGVLQLIPIIIDKLEPIDRITAYYLEDFKDEIKSLGDLATGKQGEDNKESNNKKVLRESFQIDE